ncbi:hypothetical protein [Elizabethkingia occulta]|uniref:hypothetical protein n=1 Tax=Elizabethkingia occulta TaxID=1867263 RepID=UPI000998EEEE|nr:hypothetical protein [Elizabethkingia occulta]OPB92594.1 hypothetical protein BB020_08315 [Elizabethkingia occulta]
MKKSLSLLTAILFYINALSQSFTPGSELTRNTWYNSSNGAYSLVFENDGNLVVYDSSGAITWNSETEGEGSRTIFQRDGNLVIYNTEDNAVFSTDTNNKGATGLSLQNNGSLIIYDGRGRTLWTSQSQNFGSSDDNEFDTTSKVYSLGEIPKGFRFNTEEKIYSKNRLYYLCFQDDGNLVLYREGYTRALWATGTDGMGSAAEFQESGNLVVYNGDGRIIYTSNTARKDAERLSVQGNGSLVIYNYDNIPVWISNR